jgi:hypothetical protein
MGERHDLTYLSVRTSGPMSGTRGELRKLEAVEAALFGRARCRLRVGEPKGGRRPDDDATAGAASRERDVQQWRVAGSALPEITSVSTRSTRCCMRCCEAERQRSERRERTEVERSSV